MRQPLLGVVASAVVIAIALGFIALFDFPSFVGSVSFFMLGLIPMQIVMVVLWGANPPFASSLRQPIKGIVLTLVAAVAAVVVMPIARRRPFSWQTSCIQREGRVDRRRVGARTPTPGSMVRALASPTSSWTIGISAGVRRACCRCSARLTTRSMWSRMRG